jgi:hypothetical protein
VPPCPPCAAHHSAPPRCRFKDEREAARAYDRAAALLVGPGARLNFKGEPADPPSLVHTAMVIIEALGDDAPPAAREVVRGAWRRPAAPAPKPAVAAVLAQVLAKQQAAAAQAAAAQAAAAAAPAAAAQLLLARCLAEQQLRQQQKQQEQQAAQRAQDAAAALAQLLVARSLLPAAAPAPLCQPPQAAPLQTAASSSSPQDFDLAAALLHLQARANTPVPAAGAAAPPRLVRTASMAQLATNGNASGASTPSTDTHATAPCASGGAAASEHAAAAAAAPSGEEEAASVALAAPAAAAARRSAFSAVMGEVTSLLAADPSLLKDYLGRSQATAADVGARAAAAAAAAAAATAALSGAKRAAEAAADMQPTARRCRV